MKAKFIVSPKLRVGEESGVEQVSTPLLMLTKFSGINLATELRKFVAGAFEGRLAAELAKKGFKGEPGEHLTVQLGDKCTQERVMFVGLGKSGNFNCATVRDTVKTAVNRALAHRSPRLSIPIFPNRNTSSSLGLMPTAHIIKCVAEDVLAHKKGDGVLEIELLCTPQAKRHVDKGLAKQRVSKASVCASAKKPALKKDGCVAK